MSKEDVQAHLNNRHDVDAVDKLSGDTALTAAAWNKQDEMVAFLLDKNARVGHQDHYGNTALMGAVWNGQEDLVKLLLGKGARINQKNIWGGKRP